MADGHDNGPDNAAFMTSGGIEARELAPGFEVRGYLSTELGSPGPVSYTNLTLPTILLV